MARLVRALSLALLLGLVALTPTPSFAQTTATLKTQISSRSVEAGESFTITLTAMTDKGTSLPQGPALPVPSGVSARGPSVAMQQQVTLQGGSFQQRFGISATWTLEIAKPGRYRLGPPSVTVAGRRATGDMIEVQVVPPGATPRPRHRDPLDPFGFGFPGLPGFGSDDGVPAEDLPPFPEELRIAQPEEPVAFLRAVATPTRVVVGEQVTLKIYAYGLRGPFRETNTSEPSREAFLAHTILENSYGETMFRVPIGSETWHAKKVRELALFPIRTGRLTIGAMRMGFDGRGYPNSGQHKGLVRMSAPLAIDVVEAPLERRPPGYKAGDVGRYALSVNVEPREIAAGDAISVVAKLEGTGNLPLTLKTPQKTGVTWLEPTTVDEIEPRGSRIGGWRKFSYVVRIDTPGDIDLGELALPYWDPERESYDVASAPLGTIKVRQSADVAALTAPEGDAIADAMTPRKSLGAAGGTRFLLSDDARFWWAIFLAPLGVVLAGAGRSLGKRLSVRLREREASHGSLAARALADAREALAKSDEAGAATASERAVLLALEGATGLAARAVLKSELAEKLAEHGLASGLVDDIVVLLERCDDLRFTGGEVEGGAADVVARAQTIVKAIARGAGKT